MSTRKDCDITPLYVANLKLESTIFDYSGFKKKLLILRATIIAPCSDPGFITLEGVRASAFFIWPLLT
jgi:hypothetical protein